MKETTFGELSQGDVFYYDGGFKLNTAETKSERYNYADLETGELGGLEDSVRVSVGWPIDTITLLAFLRADKAQVTASLRRRWRVTFVDTAPGGDEIRSLAVRGAEDEVDDLAAAEADRRGWPESFEVHDFKEED